MSGPNKARNLLFWAKQCPTCLSPFEGILDKDNSDWIQTLISEDISTFAPTLQTLQSDNVAIHIKQHIVVLNAELQPVHTLKVFAELFVDQRREKLSVLGEAQKELAILLL